MKKWKAKGHKPLPNPIAKAMRVIGIRGKVRQGGKHYNRKRLAREVA